MIIPATHAPARKAYCSAVQRDPKHAPPPLRVDTVRVVLAGTAVWTIALVVLLLLGDRVDRLWTWTCVAAIALAGLGLFVMRLQGQWPSHEGHDHGQSERTSKSDVS
jgi:hypothetical protein